MNEDRLEQPHVEQSSSRRTAALSRLYLDPNNFRFIDLPEYKHVAPEDAFNADVQRRTTAFILGRSQQNVQDLIASIKENGWLEIDPVLVQDKEKARYIVVEGNRRVATLKYLQRRYEEDAIDLGKLDSALFSKVPVVRYSNADPAQSLVMMGLHHITGKQRWPAVNRAEAIKKLNGYFDGDTDAVCRSLGISKREFNHSLRTLALVNSYKDSDYGDQFQSDQYNLFREILGNPPLREWLGWSNETCAASKADRLERLFLWMSQEERDDEDSALSPVITTVGHIRELSKIIEDPAALKRLDETRSLQEATLSSSLLMKNEIDRAFETFNIGFQKLDTRIGGLKPDDLDRVDQLIGRLQGVSLARKRQPPETGDRFPWKPFNEITQSQFSSIHIEKYRVINHLDLENTRRLNLIVGINNAGKTSILEAIYLLTRQNDERGLLDVVRWRDRAEREPDPSRLARQLPQKARISGTFDEVDENRTNLRISRSEDPGDAVSDHTSFLSRLLIESDYGGRKQSSDVAFFSERPRRTSFLGDRHWVCRAVFAGPFNRAELLTRYNEDSLESGTKERVVDFIREHIDPNIKNIELSDDAGRFLVTYDNGKARDLSSFGDGMRRVFEIGLLCAGARGGVLLVDEFENAIHVRLLNEFTRMVHELAIQCNVQVFLSTHSKEMVDSSVINEYRLDDIVSYVLRRSENRVDIERFDGKKFSELRKIVDFDLRGIR